MARRKRLCMISTQAENEQQHNEVQSQLNEHSTNETNDANYSQIDTKTNEHSDNQNEFGEQTDGEAMINFIKNGDQSLPCVTQVSIARTSSTEQPHLKDKSMWSDQEKKIQKIDRLARSLLIQWLPNDIYSLIESNKTAKDLWDALVRHMLEWKQYETIMRQNKNLLDINIDALYNILKKNQGDVNDAMKSKKKAVVITYDPLALVAEQTKVSKRKEKVVVSSESEGSDDELKKITALLAKAFNQKKFYFKPTNNNLRTSSATSSANKKQEYVKSDDKKEEKKVDEKKKDMSKVNDSDQEINANMVFMVQIEKVLSDSEASSSTSDDKIDEVPYYTSESESESEYETSDYYDNSTTYGLFMDNNDDRIFFHDSSEIFSENLIESQIDHNKSYVTHNNFEDVAKLINQMIKEFDKKIAKNQKHLEKANQQRKDFENQTKFFKKRKDLRPTLYDERVISLGYTSMFLTHSNEALEIKKFNRVRENKIKFAYDYGSLNASYVNEKINFSDDYFQEIINPDFEKIDSPFHQTSSLKPYVPNVILEKIIIDLEDEVVSLLEKEKDNLKIIESLISKAFESSENANFELEHQSDNDCQVVEKVCDNVKNPNVIDLGIFKLRSSKHMTGNCALLTNFVERFLGTVRFGNNDFVVIAGYEDIICVPLRKIHQKHHKSKMAFASNKPFYLLHMDLYGPMRVESINEKRYVLVVVDDYSRYTWVFFLHSKDDASEVITSFIKKTQVNLQLQVQRVRTDNGTEFKNKTLAKFLMRLVLLNNFLLQERHKKIVSRNGEIEP
nr:retrotransposon protein Ty1-copia subclass [Tanacetum cinerariifolium]